MISSFSKTEPSSVCVCVCITSWTGLFLSYFLQFRFQLYNNDNISFPYLLRRFRNVNLTLIWFKIFHILSNTEKCAINGRILKKPITAWGKNNSWNIRARMFFGFLSIFFILFHFYFFSFIMFVCELCVCVSLERSWKVFFFLLSTTCGEASVRLSRARCQLRLKCNSRAHDYYLVLLHESGIVSIIHLRRRRGLQRERRERQYNWSDNIHVVCFKHWKTQKKLFLNVKKKMEKNFDDLKPNFRSVLTFDWDGFFICSL